MTCPDCQSARVRRIQRAGVSKFLWSLAGWWPWVCDGCGRRFDSKLRDPAELGQQPASGNPSKSS